MNIIKGLDPKKPIVSNNSFFQPIGDFTIRERDRNSVALNILEISFCYIFNS